jgi:hypothetical protein
MRLREVDMALRAKLRVVLMADGVTIAETEDPRIWQAAFQAIQGDGSSLSGGDDEKIEWVPEEERVAIHAFAKELDIEIADLMAACHPRPIPPYIFLSKHHWEAFKRNTPERGRNAVSNAVLALTLLLLWAEKAHIDRITVRDGYAVLRAISARDEHASRAIENCPWLQTGLGRVQLNPESISKAISVARAFCLKQAPETDETGEDVG